MSYLYGSELVPGAYHYGGGGLGVLGSNVPASGLHGASYLYNDLSLPADAGKEVRGLVLTPPGAGSWFAWEDGSIELVGAPDGTYTFTYRLYVDGADAGTATGTIVLGDTASLNGGAVFDGLVASGVLAQAGASGVSGDAALDQIAASGTLAGVSVLGSLAGGVRRSEIARSAGVKTITARPAMIAIADLRAHCKLDTTGGVHPDDAMLLAFAESALDYCEHYCNRAFGPQTLELALDEFPSTVAVKLERRPVQSITSVKYIDTAQVEQTMAGSSYVLDDYSEFSYLVPQVGTVWPSTAEVVNAVKIRYLAGDSALPAAVRSAALLMVGHLYEHRESVAVGSWSEIPFGVRALLDTQRDY